MPLLCLFARVLAAGAVAQHRSLADFLAAQGSCITPAEAGTLPTGAQVVNGCVLYVPFAPNYVAWGVAPSQPFCAYFTTAAVDYSGVVNAWLVKNGHTSLGTTISGSVSEKRNPDGSGQVAVNLSTHNALAWGGCDPEFNFATATVLFGNRPDAVLGGATPGLANASFRIVYNEPAYGAPFPDLIDLGLQLNGYSWVSQQFRAAADGPLTSAFEDVAAGTPGHMVVGQNGTFNTTGKGAIDGFTAEFIHITTK